jgi:uncharacterized membrane protein
MWAMEIGAVAIQFLHVAAGAAWFGGSLFANAVVLPFIARQAPERQRELIGGLVLGPERVMVAAALGTAVTGLLRGTVYGRIDSLGAVASPYGLVWLTAILVAVAVFATGGRVTSPAARTLRDDDSVWVATVEERSRAADAFSRLRLGFAVELAGITVILGLMILLPRL